MEMRSWLQSPSSLTHGNIIRREIFSKKDPEAEDRQALPQEGEASQVAQEERPIGTVVRDQAPVYKEKDAQSPIKLTLNDGVVLPILNQTEGWYAVHRIFGKLRPFHRAETLVSAPKTQMFGSKQSVPVLSQFSS